MFRKAKVKLFFSHCCHCAIFAQNHTKHQTKGLEELTAKKQPNIFLSQSNRVGLKKK
jgi:hypothetical protein